MKRVALGLSTALVISVLGCNLAWCKPTAQISGTVRDQSGAVLPGAEITATQAQTGVVRTSISNETGLMFCRICRSARIASKRLWRDFELSCRAESSCRSTAIMQFALKYVS